MEELCAFVHGFLDNICAWFFGQYFMDFWKIFVWIFGQYLCMDFWTIFVHGFLDNICAWIFGQYLCIVFYYKILAEEPGNKKKNFKRF